MLYSLKKSGIFDLLDHGAPLSENADWDTGVKSFENILEACHSLNTLSPDNSLEITDMKIDNILLSIKTGRVLKLRDLNQRIREADRTGMLICHMNNDVCPGLYIKHPSGTIISFCSGSFVITGVKNYAEIRDLLKIISWMHEK